LKIKTNENNKVEKKERTIVLRQHLSIRRKLKFWQLSTETNINRTALCGVHWGREIHSSMLVTEFFTISKR
jgi:hypothetical protein